MQSPALKPSSPVMPTIPGEVAVLPQSPLLALATEASRSAPSPSLSSQQRSCDDSSQTRCMVVELDAIARIVPLQGATCGICDAIVPSLPPNTEGTVESSNSACFIDGRLVCETCRKFLEPT